MSSFTIRQRTRENQIVRTYTGNTIATGIGQVTGIATDGCSFFLTSRPDALVTVNGVFSQIDLPSGSVIREVALGFSGVGTHNIDLAHDGLNFALIHGLDLGGTQRATIISPSGGALTQLPGSAVSPAAVADGIAFDGEYYYATDADPTGFSPPNINQWERNGSVFTLIRAVTLGLGSASGLAFDGEFLVTHPANGTMDLIYLDRQSMTVVKTVGGEAIGANHQAGMTYDGEFFYTLESVAG